MPDPYGERESYAEHFIVEFADALARMGVRMREVRQSELYPRGTYNAAIRQAMDRRVDVFDILAQFQATITVTCREWATLVDQIAATT